VYARYPQLFTASSTAWQSLSSVPPVPSSPGSTWDESYEDLGTTLRGQGTIDDIATSSNLFKPPGNEAEELKEMQMGAVTKRQRVKAVVEKLTLAKAFGREEGKATRKEKRIKKEKSQVIEKVEIAAPVMNDKDIVQQALSTASSVDEARIDDSSVPTGSPPPRPQLYTVIENEAEAQVDSFTIQGNVPPQSGQSSNGEATAEVEKERKEKESLSGKFFSELKNVLLKLGCQTGTEN